MGLREAKKLQCIFRTGEACIGDALALRQRKKLHHCGGDHAECTFRADKQILQIIAGIVFLDITQIVQDFARRQHNLDAKTKFTRIAVGQNRGSTRIGREIAANLAGAFRTER